MRGLWVAAALLVAGCAAPGGADDEGAPIATGGDAPQWRAGDWWTYRFSSDVYEAAFEATLVVGEVLDDGYLLGMPVDAYQPDAILFHVPPVGRLSRDLAWVVHDAEYQPLAFPLEDGASWETAWAATKLKLTARADGSTWRVTNEGDASAQTRRIEAQYDPSVGWLLLHERAFADGRVLERIELVEWGRGFTGAVRVMDGVQVLLVESRSAGVLDAGAPGVPTATFTPPADVDTLLVACVFGGAPGSYSARIGAPDGAAACEHGGAVAPGDAKIKAKAAEVPSNAGAWEARLVAVGQGSATAEVLGYRARDVQPG